MKNAPWLLIVLLVFLGGVAWLFFADRPQADLDRMVKDQEAAEALEAAKLMEDGPGRSADGLQRGDLETGTTGTPGSAAPDGPNSFLGRVVDLQGEGLEGVSIRATGFVGWAGAWSHVPSREEVAWETTSAADGRFSFPPVPREGLRFQLAFRAADLAPVDLQAQPAGQGRSRDLGEVVLGPGARIEGRVLLPLGSPVADAEVTPFLADSLAAFTGGTGDQSPVASSVRTDAQGRFRIEGMPSGQLRLQASKEGFVAGWSSNLRTGHGTVLEGVELQLLEGKEMSGQVVDVHQRPIAGARLVVQADAQDANGLRSQVLETTTDEQGRFAVRYPATTGRLQLTATAPGHWVLEKAYDPVQATQGLKVHMRPMQSLVGLVVDEAGGPVEGAEVHLVTASPYPIDPSAAVPLGSVATAPDGTFSLLPDLGRAGRGPFQLVAMKEGRVPASSEAFPMRSGPEPPAVDLRLILMQGAAVHGEVTDTQGQPVAHARVSLVALRPAADQGSMFGASTGPRQGDRVASQRCDGQGRFRFEGVAPGDYRLEASHRGFSPSISEDFTVEQGEHLQALVLPAVAGIEGKVVGDLRGYVGLHVLALHPGQAELQAPVSADGSFRFDSLLPGSWDLELHEEQTEAVSMAALWGRPPALANRSGVVVPAGETVSVDLPLESQGRGSVEGTVQVQGAPASGYSVYLVPQSTSEGDGGMGLFGSGSDGGRQRMAPTDHTGAYRFPGVEVGDYWLVLCRPGGFPDFLTGTADPAPTGLMRQTVQVVAQEASVQDLDALVGSLVCLGDEVHLRGAVPVRLLPEPLDGRRAHRFLLRHEGHRIPVLAAGGYRMELGEEAAFGTQSLTVQAGGVLEVLAKVASGVEGEGGKGRSSSEKAEEERQSR